MAVKCARLRLNEALSGIKESFVNGLRAAIPEPHASLAAGLIIGSREGLPDDIKESFKRTGLSHIVLFPAIT